MTVFYKKLLSLCENAGMSPLELARKCGLSTSMPTYWRNSDRVPNAATLEKIAQFFGVTPAFLKGEEEDDVPKVKYIPVFGRVAAGIPIEAIGDIVDQEQLSPNMDMSYEYCGLIIHGDSMSPQFLDGDTAIVRLQNDVESGDIAIVFINGTDATCKKIKKEGDDIELISLNEKYAPMRFDANQVKTLPITIFGKVVEMRRKYK